MKENTSFASWMIALQGILAILFGVIIIAWSGLTLGVMIYLFAFFVILQGFVALGYGISYRKTDPAWWTYIVEAILGFIVGIAVMVWPGISGLVFVYFIAAWAVLGGIIKIVIGLVDQDNWKGKLVQSVLGILFIIFGIFLFAKPGKGAMFMVDLIGLFSIVIGVFSFFFAFQVKKIGKELVEASTKE